MIFNVLYYDILIYFNDILFLTNYTDDDDDDILYYGILVNFYDILDCDFKMIFEHTILSFLLFFFYSVTF